MTTVTLTVPDAQLALLKEIAAAENSDLAGAALHAITTAQEVAEARAILNGPFHLIEESDARIRAKHGLPPYKSETPEEAAAAWDAAIDALTPEQRREAEAPGLL